MPVRWEPHFRQFGLSLSPQCGIAIFISPPSFVYFLYLKLISLSTQLLNIKISHMQHVGSQNIYYQFRTKKIGCIPSWGPRNFRGFAQRNVHCDSASAKNADDLGSLAPLVHQREVVSAAVAKGDTPCVELRLPKTLDLVWIPIWQDHHGIVKDTRNRCTPWPPLARAEQAEVRDAQFWNVCRLSLQGCSAALLGHSDLIDAGI